MLITVDDRYPFVLSSLSLREPGEGHRNGLPPCGFLPLELLVGRGCALVAVPAPTARTVSHTDWFFVELTSLIEPVRCCVSQHPGVPLRGEFSFV